MFSLFFFAFFEKHSAPDDRRQERFGPKRPAVHLSFCLVTLFLLSFCFFPQGSLAAEKSEAQNVARFALVIGANRSIDKDLPVLSYADDDAARYYDLFQTLKIPTRLIATLDNSTAKLHPDASVVALPSVGASLDVQVLGLISDVNRARDDDKKVEVFVVFAGHGNHKNGVGYLTLEDRRIQGKELFVDLVDRIGADRTHLIVDACYSFLLTRDRGPGGRRKAAQGFASMSNLADRGVGLILSTSSATRSHEWAGFQAGVFSHEIRSGLYGAADVNGDGKISYLELAAFVTTANRGVKNERFRPKIFVRPPKGQSTLLDLRVHQTPTIEIDGALAGHYLLEDQDGIRYFDVHNNSSQNLSLLRPAKSPLYLRRMKNASTAGEIEYVIREPKKVTKIALLDATRPQGKTRGAANDAFSVLFEKPYSERQLDRFSLSDVSLPEDESSGWMGIFGGITLGVSTALVVVGTGALVLGIASVASLPAEASGEAAVAANDILTLSEASFAVVAGTGLVVGVFGGSLLVYDLLDDGGLE